MALVIRGMWIFTLFLVLLIGVAACGGSQATGPTGLSIPTSTPRMEIHVNTTWLVPPSIDWQIFSSSVIVRATLDTATAGTETVPSGQGVAPTYLPVQALRFTVHEYLKGSGKVSSQIEIVVRGDHSYTKETAARNAANSAIAQRNTIWDGREGILFLNNLTPPLRSGGAGVPTGMQYEFALSNPVVQSSWDYSIDSLSRVWLPAMDGEGASGTSPVFNAKSPTAEISLVDLRTKIAALSAELASGAGIAGFELCVHDRILAERYSRARAEPWTPIKETATLSSGSAEGTQLYSELFNYQSETQYHLFWPSGRDASLFRAPNVDTDTIPSNGYHATLAVDRPLPAGTYKVLWFWQHYEQVPCNDVPTQAYRDFTVTVTAPRGTVHEALFDPTSTSMSAGFQGSQGVLNPATFSLGDASSSIVGLGWEDGEVTLVLSPYGSLAGKRLEFIELDGTVGLSLGFDDGVSDGESGTVVWGVDEQPWKSGDRLMIRIR